MNNRTNYKSIGLTIEEDFGRILMLDKVSLYEDLLNRLANVFDYDPIVSCDNPDNGFIFARGTLPVCLCAHMDKIYFYDDELRTLKKVLRKEVKDAKGNVIDYWLHAKEGIGGDDRCGVYAIISMLNKGFRPSVLFCMGEEHGCRGSRNFCDTYPKDYLEGINAFIQIDRRGNKDCVNYSDRSMELVTEINKFGFKYAYGSCTDISVLMPHFGISGVNLSSGYYHEHSGKNEYISVKDFNYLLKRLEKILASNIFNKKYIYKSMYNDLYTYAGSYYSNNRFAFNPYSNKKDSSNATDENSKYHQLQLDFDDDKFYEASMAKCDYCGFTFFKENMVEVFSPNFDLVCPSCAKELERQGYTRCSCGECKKLFLDLNSDGQCPFCGNDNNIDY